MVRKKIGVVAPVETKSKNELNHSQTQRRFFRSAKPRAPRITGPVKLLKQTLRFISQNKWLWFGILFFYAILQVLLVQGVLGGDIREFGETFRLVYEDVSSGEFRLAILTYVLTTTGQASTESGAIFQTIGTLIVSLALIWAIRQSMAGTHVTIRDAYYKGMYPLIPFVLVLLVVLLQLVPLAIGAWLYQTLIIGGIAVTLIEQIILIIVSASLALVTIYLLCSSVFALYIATLPDMTPIKALRSARGLVKYRRGSIVLRVLFIGLILLLVSAFILLPILFVIPVAATWVFFLLGVVSLGLYITYMYCLYRELLNESK